jgi:drug/metabolite transporter (DMT)-like permease
MRAIDLSKRSWQLATLLFLSLVWGSSFILIKKSLISFTPVELATMRMFIAFMVLSPVVVMNFRKFPINRWYWIALAGFFGNALPSLLFAIAQTNLSSSIAGFTNSSTPLFTLIVGAWFFGTFVKRAALAGVITGLAGAGFLMLSSGMEGDGSSYFYWFIALSGSVCYSISTNIIKVHLQFLEAKLVTSFAFMFVGPPMLIYLLANNTFQKAFSTHETIISFVYLCILAVVGTAFAVLIFNYLIKHTTALFASAVTYLIPVVALFWGVIDGEKIGLIQIIGLTGIVLGISLINKAKS